MHLHGMIARKLLSGKKAKWTKTHMVCSLKRDGDIFIICKHIVEHIKIKQIINLFSK